MKRNQFRIILILAGLLFGGLLSGCANYVEVNGVKYKTLTDSQRRELVYRARLALYKNTKLVPKSDYVFIAGNEPEMKIDYAGDRLGTAKLTWKLPKRHYTIVFDGHLGTDQMTYLLQITDQVPDVINFTGQDITIK